MTIINDRSIDRMVHDSYHPTGEGEETAVRTVLTSGRDGSLLHSCDGVLVAMSYEHCKTHDGLLWTCNDYDDDVDPGTPKYWLMECPESPIFCHLRTLMTSSKNGLAEVFVNPTVSANGTLLYNSNNNISNIGDTSYTKFYRDPTVINEGSRRYVHVMGSDSVSPTGATGGQQKRDSERILGLGVLVLFKFSALSTDTRVSVDFDFYEEDESP